MLVFWTQITEKDIGFIVVLKHYDFILYVFLLSATTKDIDHSIYPYSYVV